MSINKNVKVFFRRVTKFHGMMFNCNSVVAMYGSIYSAYTIQCLFQCTMFVSGPSPITISSVIGSTFVDICKNKYIIYDHS